MQTIELDLAMRRIVPLLHAKQNDVGKKVAVVLTDNGAAYSIPGDAVFSVWYSGASGEGNYTTIDDRSAFSVSGNTVTVELILQMLQNKGPGQLCLVMNKADGTQLGLWNIPYFVEEIPGAGSQEATAYYTAFQEAVQGMGAAGIESDAFPGCYYRIVNGETEWINPPMAVGEEYRTAERYNGKAVYTKIVRGYVRNSMTLGLGLDGARHDVFDIRARFKRPGAAFYIPAQHDGIECKLSAGEHWLAVVTLPYADQGNTYYEIQLWYTKTEADVLG